MWIYAKRTLYDTISKWEIKKFQRIRSVAKIGAVLCIEEIFQILKTCIQGERIRVLISALHKQNMMAICTTLRIPWRQKMECWLLNSILLRESFRNAVIAFWWATWSPSYASNPQALLFATVHIMPECNIFSHNQKSRRALHWWQ